MKKLVQYTLFTCLSCVALNIGAQDKIANNNPKPTFCSERAKQLCNLGLSDDSIPQLIDLGLSVQWADCNVGADRIADYGGLYQWAEVTGDLKAHVISDYVNYPYDIAGNSSYDIATKNWGAGFRIPTRAEFQELVETCTWIWTQYHDVKGYKISERLYEWERNDWLLKNVDKYTYDSQGRRIGSISYE